MGATVVAMDMSAIALEKLGARLGTTRLHMVEMNAVALEEQLHRADAVICAALAPGACAPRLISRKMLAGMKRYWEEQSGYMSLQNTRPQSVGFALTDSLVGLAAWIYALFQEMTDSGGQPERVIPAAACGCNWRCRRGFPSWRLRGLPIRGS